MPVIYLLLWTLVFISQCGPLNSDGLISVVSNASSHGHNNAPSLEHNKANGQEAINNNLPKLRHKSALAFKTALKHEFGDDVPFALEAKSKPKSILEKLVREPELGERKLLFYCPEFKLRQPQQNKCHFNLSPHSF